MEQGVALEIPGTQYTQEYRKLPYSEFSHWPICLSVAYADWQWLSWVPSRVLSQPAVALSLSYSPLALEWTSPSSNQDNRFIDKIYPTGLLVKVDLDTNTSLNGSHQQVNPWNQFLKHSVPRFITYKHFISYYTDNSEDRAGNFPD